MTDSQKNVVITGGAAGIGLAMAKSFLAENVRVAICDANPEVIAKFQQLHPDVIAQVADVTNKKEINQFLGEVERQWGYADVVCANAGTGGPAGLIEDLDYQQWQHCIVTNVHGSFLTCRWVARVMRKRGKGLIILTSSTAGIMGYPLRSPYAAAKWAIVGICKTLAMELGSAGIGVNAICLGAVEGERMDRVISNEEKTRGKSEDEVRASYVNRVSMKTWVSAQDIAASAVFLASDAGSKISGQILSVDGNTETLAL